MENIKIKPKKGSKLFALFLAFVITGLMWIIGSLPHILKAYGEGLKC